MASEPLFLEAALISSRMILTNMGHEKAALEASARTPDGGWVLTFRSQVFFGTTVITIPLDRNGRAGEPTLTDVPNKPWAPTNDKSPQPQGRRLLRGHGSRMMIPTRGARSTRQARPVTRWRGGSS